LGLLLKESARMRYVVVIERLDTGFRAVAPDLPGCVAFGQTRDEAVNRLRRNVRLRLDTLYHRNQRPPAPTTETTTLHFEMPVIYGDLPTAAEPAAPLARIKPQRRAAAVA
jgi:predicted RNase H-like HicB family nuclease